MTLAFDSPLDAIGCAVERLKALGVPPLLIAANNSLLIEGSVVVSRDRGAGQLPFICIAEPDAQFSGIRATLGL